MGNEDYGALIVSESEIFPYDRLECFGRFAEEGLPVIFTNSLLVCSAERKDISSLLTRFEPVMFETLAAHVRERGFCHVGGEKERE
ncbi:MAG: hypothetical protein IJY47_08040 [Clostridia bacterium]|nr:hypothetical protein [Clostridia bacterium]